MRRNYKRMLGVVLILVLGIVVITGCTQEEPGSIILATTTSTENSGLLDYIIPVFEEETGIEVKVVAVGTGKALQMGRDGEADVLLVHAKEREITFVEEGHGTERFEVMYNDFVIIGPKDDPADLLNNAKADIIAGFVLINEGEFEFVSRGDDSGTHTKERNLWAEAGIEPSGDWYISAGRGMGDVIQMADEKQAYTLTDRATFLALRETIDLVVSLEGDSKLFNQYGIIPVNPEKNDAINHDGAMEFANWILSDEAQKLIAGFGVEKFGQALFIPNAE
ncbi:MAG: substrate-binding domain-containing protein [Alkaliphilus sp.]